MQPDLPTNTQALGCRIGKSQAFGLIAAKRRSATRPLAGPLFGETKPISPCSASRAPAPTRLTKRTQFRLRRQPLATPKSATSSYSLALGQLRRTNPIPPFRHLPPAAPRLTERSQFQRIRPPREKLTGKVDGRSYLRRVQRSRTVLVFPRSRCFPESPASLAPEFAASDFHDFTAMTRRVGGRSTSPLSHCPSRGSPGRR